MMCPYTKTVDGFEMHIGINHLGRAFMEPVGISESLQLNQFVSNVGKVISKIKCTERMILTCCRPLPVDIPSNRAFKAQRSGSDCGGLLSGTQLWLDPLPWPSQPGQLQQRISILPEQTGKRTVHQRAGFQTQRYTNTKHCNQQHKVWEKLCDIHIRERNDEHLCQGWSRGVLRLLKWKTQLLNVTTQSFINTLLKWKYVAKANMKIYRRNVFT